MANDEELADNDHEFELDMSNSGVLIADGKYTKAQTQEMTSSDVRNTVIVELSKIFNKRTTVVTFQRYSDDENVAIYGVVIVLKKVFDKPSDWFNDNLPDDARNALIIELDMKTKTGIEDLQAKNNGELIQMALGVLNNSKKVQEVVEFRFDQNDFEATSNPPNALFEEYYTNSTSQPFKKTIKISKKSTKQSSFVSTTGMSLNYGVTTSVSAGVEGIAQAGVETSLNFGLAQEYQFGKKSVVEKEHVDTTEITIAPHTYVKLEMVVTQAKMKVKWYATVRTADGFLKKDEGWWHDVESFNQHTTIREVATGDIPGGRGAMDVTKM